MADDKDIFARAVVEAGGMLNTEGMPADSLAVQTLNIGNQVVEVASKYVERLPPIYVGIVNNSMVNAFAFAVEGHQFVAIHSGSLIAFHAIFMGMLADSRFFRNVGDPNMEPIRGASLQGFNPAL